MRTALRTALVLAVLLLAVRLVWIRETRAPRRTAEAPPETLLVEKGATAEMIGRELVRLGFVRHPLIFRALVRARGVSGRLHAGEYRLEGPLSLEQVVEMLARGDVVHRAVTIPEGRNLQEIAALAAQQGLSADELLVCASDPSAIRDLDPDAANLEGYLFPDTYDLARTPDASCALVRRMVQRFRDVVGPEQVHLAARGMTVRQMVTLASIVELETARAEERPRIAAVFLNRLQKRMPLQTDPTVIYALRKSGRWDGNIRKRDLEIDSPYNTYRRAGLPPGPIGSPGREAIRAVLEPTDTRDLYFVSRNDGTHHFSETLAEHNRAVNRYQRRGARS